VMGIEVGQFLWSCIQRTGDRKNQQKNNARK
jgi:hypothetical protein